MLSNSNETPAMRVAVVMPAYKVKSHILDVVTRTMTFADAVYVIDDCCPDASGALVEEQGFPVSVRVLRHAENRGVGGAVKTGYAAALADGYDIVVKVDGDGQMAPELIPQLVGPILDGEADYVKGNRFFNPEDLAQMPKVRLVGNAGLSFISKLSSGYWDVMDPTNGFTAIHRTALAALPLDKIADRYFFESDMLFRLNLANAVVQDFPMQAHYANEVSNLSVRRVLVEFPQLYTRNFGKRVFYSYLVRDFNAASVQSVLGIILLFFGGLFGALNWLLHGLRGEGTPLGTIMVATLPIILGVQLLLAALALDVASVPRKPLQRRLRNRAADALQPERHKVKV